MKRFRLSQKTILFQILVLVISASLIKASTVQWASMTWVAIACSFALINIRHYSSKAQYVFSHSLCCLIAFQIWALIQLITPISHDTNASLETLLLGIGILCLLSLLSIGLREEKHFHLLFKTIIGFACLQALYGLGTMISQYNMLLWMPKLFYLDRPTGTFVNANHFAAYISIAIILLGSYQACLLSQQRQPFTFWKLFDQLYNPSNLILAILIIALLASRSIGAIGALALATLIAIVQIARYYQRTKLLLLLSLIIAGLIIVFILSIDYTIIEKEITSLSHTITRRWALTEAAWGATKAHWLFGVGGGSFYSIFSQYRDLNIGNTYYNYAHNDFLQFWIEYGLIGISLLATFVLLCLRDNLQILTTSKTPIRRAFAYASLYSTLTLAIHSLVDFPLHIPGYSVLYLTLISVNSLSARKGDQ